MKTGLTDRQTCLCKKHANLQFKADRLHQLGILSEKTLGLWLKVLLVTDNANAACTMSVPPVAVLYQNTLPWNRIPMPMLSGGGNGYLRKNKNLVILVRTFNAKSPGKTKSLAHFSNLNHSLQLMFSSSENMSSTSATITMPSVNSVNDVRLHQMNVSYTLTFPTNYSCGYSSEIQSIHFGASHNQATLHTGILYVDQDTFSFCTISDSRRHDPAAIWSYLSPVFEYIRHNHSDVNTVHFVSDGPTTQYRQKKNLYLFRTQLYKEGFAGGGSWNFSEAGHSKGATDGV